MSELWQVIIVDTPEGKYIGIDQLSSGINPMDALSNPMSEKEASQLCKELSVQLNIPLFKA